MRLLVRLLAVVGMAACREDQEGPGILTPSDARFDAPRPSGDAGFIIDAPNQPLCNVLTQTGCGMGERCTWIKDSEDPPSGHIGCTHQVSSPKAIGVGCVSPTTGADDCVPGAVCLGGVCKQICDLDGNAPICAQDRTCIRYADLFEFESSTFAGVCDPGCDPLTQELKLGANRTACGSPTPNMPNSGCYGFDAFSCAPVSAQTLELLDRDPPRTNSSGNPYLNGCAPGFIPFLYESTGSTTKLCTGFCAVLEIDNTQPTNLQGDPTALAKMPNDPMAIAGHGVCSASYKGSSTTSSCRFLYPYLENDQGLLPLAFEQSAYVDTLGICLDEAAFSYDDDMNAQTPNVPYPSCASLPKRSSATPGDFDDAADWGCQRRSSTNAVVKKLRSPSTFSTEMMRRHLH